QLLCQRALRREFELEFAGEELALELLVLADVAGNHPLDLARLEQLAQTEAVDTGVVRDDREVAHPTVAKRIDEGLGNAAKAEASHGKQLTILHDALQRHRGARVDLVHGPMSPAR